MSIRITDSYLSSILVGDLNRSLASLLEQQRMAGSMQRVNSYADDPRAVSSIQQLNALITRNDSYLRNIGRSRTLVDGTDIALQDLSEILADARVLAMRESSSLANSDTMGNAVFEIDNLVGRMLEVLNTSIEGHHLFAGQRTDEAPFRLSGGSVVYLGDDGEIIARTGPHSTMPVNLGAWERERGYPLLKDPILAQDSPEWRATAERQHLNLLAGVQPVAPALETTA